MLWCIALVVAVAADEPPPPAFEAPAPSVVTPETPVAAEPAAEPPPARRYASGSLSTLGSAAVGVGLVGASAAGAGFTGGTVNGGVAVRWVTRLGLTLEPRLGADALFATGASGLYAVFAARAGLGVGYALAPAPNVGLAPMLAYELVFAGGGITAHLSGLQHAVSLELPVSFFFGRNVFVELYGRGGVAATAVGAVPIFALGYRFGLVWR